MNDDLYGHDLKDGERVTFVQNPRPVLFYYLMFIVLYFSARLLTDLVRAPDEFMTHETAATAAFAFVIAATVIAVFWTMLDWNLIPRHRQLPALITNYRVIAANGIDIMLDDIASIRRGWMSVKINGQNEADGLTLRALPHAKSFHAALERQLT